MNLFQNLHSVFLGYTFLQQFLLHILAHKFPLDQHIVLAMPYEVFHLGLLLGNLCRGEILDERLSPVSTGGRNHGDQLVCRWLFGHERKLHGGSLPELILASTAYQLPHFQPDHVMELQAIEFVL
jgi:hypothetical protein